MNDFSDREVWQRVLGGESRAYGLVWDRHRDRVFRHLIHLGSSATDAEDLSAVVFLELWRRRGAVRFVDDSLLPWLLVTAQNVTRNAARSRRRYRALLGRLPAPRHAADPAEIIADRDPERSRIVREVLAASSAGDRALVLLTTLEGLTVREAATAVGLSESAAKMRLSRLRVRLSAGLEGQAAVEGAAS